MALSSRARRNADITAELEFTDTDLDELWIIKVNKLYTCRLCVTFVSSKRSHIYSLLVCNSIFLTRAVHMTNGFHYVFHFAITTVSNYQFDPWKNPYQNYKGFITFKKIKYRYEACHWSFWFCGAFFCWTRYVVT